MAIFDKLASAIRNNVVSGIPGYHTNTSFTLEQICDDIADIRVHLLTLYALAGKISLKEHMLSINCIPIDCKDIEKCSSCMESLGGTPTAHFEIPLILFIGGLTTIDYIGSTDKQNPFLVYTSLKAQRMQKYKRRKNNKPYVWIDLTPNENGMYDCFVFNAPLLKAISVVAVFKDLRLLEDYGCCSEINPDNLNSLNTEIKLHLSEHYLRYYRLGHMPNLPNNLLHLP